MKWFSLFLALLVQPALAVTPDEVLKDTAMEARARELSKELRCMVCQNQSIDDSDAPLAKDLRLLVRERLVKGDSDQQVMDYLVSRYGDFVLLRPRISIGNMLLWGAPLLVLALGGLGVVIAMRRRAQAATAPAPLTEEEKKRLAELVDPQITKV